MILRHRGTRAVRTLPESSGPFAGGHFYAQCDIFMATTHHLVSLVEGVMFDAIAIFAAHGTVWERLLGSAMSFVVGLLFVLAGIRNVQTQKAEEGGKARSVNRLLGLSNNYEGKKAVLTGWIRIASGVALIVFAIVFLFVGPWAKR